MRVSRLVGVPILIIIYIIVYDVMYTAGRACDGVPLILISR